MALYQREFEIPRELLRKNQKFSMDFGGTLIKVVYIEEEEDKSHVKLHLATFPTGDLTKACEFIKEHVNYEEGSNVTLTGMGAIPDKGKIEEALNVKVSPLMEGEALYRGFYMWQNNFPERFYKLNMDSEKQYAEELTDFMEAQNTGKDKTNLGSEKPRTPKDGSPDQLVLQLGSCAGIMKFNADGSHKLIMASTTCGQTLLGLGTLLAEAKSFGELMTLAASGDNRNVHRCAKDIKENTNVYDALPDDCIIHQFGKAFQRPQGSLKREDLAASLISCLLENLIMMGLQACRYEKVKTLYVYGSMIEGSEVVRKEFAQGWARMSAILAMQEPIEIRLIKDGTYTAAIGALLKEE